MGIDHPSAMAPGRAAGLDLETTYLLLVRNSVLDYTKGRPDPSALASVTLTRSALDDLALGFATFEDEAEKGKITIDGDHAAFTRFLDLLDTFEFWFDIVTP